MTELALYQAIVRQGMDFLHQLDDAEYPRCVKGQSIGAHMRHILDHWQAVYRGQASGRVDYELRRRGHRVERVRAQALAELHELNQWIAGLGRKEMSTPVTCLCDLGQEEVALLQHPSTLGRELLFACSHAIHHYAVIALQLRQRHIPAPANFGVAPSTLHQPQALCAL